MKLATLGILAIGALAIAGCDAYVTPPGAAVEVDAGYTPVYDTYYTGGHYDNGYWYWHDREGHYYRENRAIHEHRIAEHEHHEEHR